VVVRPGETITNGTILVRDGLIQAVGTHLAIPDDARVWDMTSNTIYAGFIEPYFVEEATNPPIYTDDSEPVNQRTLAAGGYAFFGTSGDLASGNKAGPGGFWQGFTPEYRAVRNFTPGEKSTAGLRELGFTAALVVPGRGIIRGTSALVQLADGEPNDSILRPDVFQHIAFDTHDDDDAIFPGSLMGVIAGVRQSFFDAKFYQLDHADYARHPAGRSRPEYNPALEALGPALDRTMPVLFEPGSVLMDDRAARVAAELGLNFALVACGQEWRRPDVAKSTGATFIVPVNFPSLPEMPDEDDWTQVTLEPLRAWDWAAENPALLRQQGLTIALTTRGLADPTDFRPNLRLALDRGLSEEDALAALTTVPAHLCGADDQLGTIEAGHLANLTVVTGGSYFDPAAKVTAVWVEGRIFPQPPEGIKPPAAPEANNASPTNQVVAANNPTNAADMEALRDLQKRRVAHSPLEGRGAITNPPAVLVRNAVIWTSGPQGILTNAEMLVAGGKIIAVGVDVPNVPATAFVLDAGGGAVTPGIVDCHSHSDILGLVNESTLPSTAMVRIRDVVNSESPNIRRQLAGGVTTVNLFHGSANPIGGQTCVIKLRDGEGPEDLVFSNAPGGIKFALGENVKQSNWGDKFVTRFPQTRMGVQTFDANRFTAAKQYLVAWDHFRRNGGLAPRRDLELEALGEVLQGQRFIHCHAYRQDEMLMLTRLMQSFGVQIGTFQHGLEGYKIADELSAAGIGVSTFSDWWGYKFEVYDAIPYNGSLLRDRGVTVSFNSDSSELARTLYLEAAKAVKYGGTPPAEAFKFVSLNAAIQLRIDQYTGSLEAGKDADFVLWSRSPLDSATVCEQTWIDGKKYYDRELEPANNARLQQEYDDLLAKARKVGKLAGGGADASSDGGKSFFDVGLEHQYDSVDRDCLDGTGGRE
jgi:imidazolonepropionase-like amidohydrolase